MAIGYAILSQTPGAFVAAGGASMISFGSLPSQHQTQQNRVSNLHRLLEINPLLRIEQGLNNGNDI